MTTFDTLEKQTDDRFDRGDVHPNVGGCWFCYRDEGEMLFSFEFDTNYHPDCAKKAGVAHYADPVYAYERHGGEPTLTSVRLPHRGGCCDAPGWDT